MATYTLTDNNINYYGFSELMYCGKEHDIELNFHLGFRNGLSGKVEYKKLCSNNKNEDICGNIKNIMSDLYNNDIILTDDNNILKLRSNSGMVLEYYYDSLELIN